MSLLLKVGDWSNLQGDACPIRHEVFVIEQKVPVALEWDDMDAVCIHAVAYAESGQALGTGRLLPDGYIGRLAVKKIARGMGVGSEILQALMQQAKKRGDHVVLLHAQIQAEEFYQGHGFIREGEEFIEAGIMHIQMRYQFEHCR